MGSRLDELTRNSIRGTVKPPHRPALQGGAVRPGGAILDFELATLGAGQVRPRRVSRPPRIAPGGTVRPAAGAVSVVGDTAEVVPIP
ncbi:MAG: hypothetical protein QOG76_8432, partial [Pseudonocardiales bacterium]|nr:hypothetical protein [Pseudonocardiales bacterium]